MVAFHFQLQMESRECSFEALNKEANTQLNSINCPMHLYLQPHCDVIADVIKVK